MNIIELKETATSIFENCRKEIIDLITDFVKEHGTVDIHYIHNNGRIDPYTALEFSEITKEVFVLDTTNNYSKLKSYSVDGLISLLNCDVIKMSC